MEKPVVSLIALVILSGCNADDSNTTPDVRTVKISIGLEQVSDGLVIKSLSGDTCMPQTDSIGFQHKVATDGYLLEVSDAEYNFSEFVTLPLENYELTIRGSADISLTHPSDTSSTTRDCYTVEKATHISATDTDISMTAVNGNWQYVSVENSNAVNLISVNGQDLNHVSKNAMVDYDYGFTYVSHDSTVTLLTVDGDVIDQGILHDADTHIEVRYGGTKDRGIGIGDPNFGGPLFGEPIVIEPIKPVPTYDAETSCLTGVVGGHSGYWNASDNRCTFTAGSDVSDFIAQEHSTSFVEDTGNHWAYSVTPDGLTTYAQFGPIPGSYDAQSVCTAAKGIWDGYEICDGLTNSAESHLFTTENQKQLVQTSGEWTSFGGSALWDTSPSEWSSTGAANNEFECYSQVEGAGYSHYAWVQSDTQCYAPYNSETTLDSLKSAGAVIKKVRAPNAEPNGSDEFGFDGMIALSTQTLQQATDYCVGIAKAYGSDTGLLMYHPNNMMCFYKVGGGTPYSSVVSNFDYYNTFPVH
ncbi:hypothetical protein EJ063_11430 [Vibrio aquaticus]|uniref:Uncharacterized protein n=1 Tax=Vibrio aquaticus TaxID=2496559 RepID=A0A432CVF1_9VIBR|nr:hypothetical protein [Vibrio aquaticus]RTZ15680.1 hypothetical protein EJ063_11430 [Vibrio aquaticus]